MITAVRVVVLLAFVGAMPAAWASACCANSGEQAGSCCQHEAARGTCTDKAECSMSGCSHHAKGCCGEATQFADPVNVHWVHKGVSFGNYMKFAKAEFAAPMLAAPGFGPIFFDFDKSNLRPESVQAVQALVEYLRANPGQTVRIEGNCCDIGSEQYNVKLGERRAKVVKRFLTENGIDASRIETISHGESKPKFGADQRQLNRRDDFVIELRDVPK